MAGSRRRTTTRQSARLQRNDSGEESSQTQNIAGPSNHQDDTGPSNQQRDGANDLDSNERLRQFSSMPPDPSDTSDETYHLSSHKKGFKIEKVPVLKHTDTLRRFHAWDFHVNRIFKAGHERYRNDEDKILKALDFVDDTLSSLYSVAVFTDESLGTDWSKFTTWLKNNLRDGNNGPIQINILYTEARQRPNQSPVEFHAYLLSLERDISMTMDGTSFMTRLEPELQNDILRTGIRPQERQAMVEHAQTIWLGRQGLAKLINRKSKNDSQPDRDNQKSSHRRGRRRSHSRHRSRSRSRGRHDRRSDRRYDDDRSYRRYRQRSNDRGRNRDRSRSPARNNSNSHRQDQHDKDNRKSSFNVSTEEYERRKKEGLCFNCGQSGHVASDCRETNKAQAIKKRREDRRHRSTSRNKSSN